MEGERQRLTPENGKRLIHSVDMFLLDCDGVIWKGDKLIDGVPEALQFLRSKGKKLLFVTNNCSKSRRQYAAKFLSLGVTVSEDEIFSSSFAASMYLQVNHFSTDSKVYVMGREGVVDELRSAGFTAIGGPDDDDKRVLLKSDCLMQHDKTVGAVVVGLDLSINYYKLQYATLCLRENPNCLFIATCRDNVAHLTERQEWAGPGAMVSAVRGSTGRDPVVVGKPSSFIMDFLLHRWNISPSRVCMVGDRLDTDILFGKDAGCKTLLVLSGVTSLLDLHHPSNSILPDFYTDHLPDLTRLMHH